MRKTSTLFALLIMALLLAACAMAKSSTTPASINPYRALHLDDVESIEMIPNVPGGVPAVIEGASAQRLARAFDADLQLTGRARCPATYTLLFRLPNGKTRELGIVGCDLEHPPYVRGEEKVFGVQDAKGTLALQQVLSEVAVPLLPHPMPSPTPAEARS